MLGALWLMRNVPPGRGSELPWWHDLFDTLINSRTASRIPKSASHDEAIPSLPNRACCRQGTTIHFCGSMLGQNSKQSMVNALQPWRAMRFRMQRSKIMLRTTNVLVEERLVGLADQFRGVLLGPLALGPIAQQPFHLVGHLAVGDLLHGHAEPLLRGPRNPRRCPARRAARRWSDRGPSSGETPSSPAAARAASSGPCPRPPR